MRSLFTLAAAIALPALALPAVAEAQLTVPEGFVVEDVVRPGSFDHISGLAARDDGTIYVSDLGGADPLLARIDGENIEVLIEGLPLGSPGRMLFGDGRPTLGTDLVLADWNGTGMAGCCDGQTLRIDPETGAIVDTLSAGTPGRATGDAFGLALGRAGAGALSHSLYVMDFQGASPQPPVLFRAADGAPTYVLDHNDWTTDRKPGSMVMGRGDYGANLYIVDGANPPTVWRLDGGLGLSVFARGNPMIAPVAIAQAPAGPFAGSIFVLDPSAHALFMLDSTGGLSIFAKDVVGTQFSDMAFSADGQSLYLGLGDRLLRISAEAACR